VKPRPPCPGDSDGPPGHHKTLPPPGRPCSGNGDHDTGKGHGQNGIVFVLPLGLAGLFGGATRRVKKGRRRTA
jgi:hypothetical protein